MSKMTLYGIWLSGPTYKAGLALSLMGQAFAYKHVDLRAGLGPFGDDLEPEDVREMDDREQHG